MGLLDNHIKEIESSYIPVAIFMDLIALQKQTKIVEVVRYLLSHDFDKQAQVFFIDSAYRVSELEDQNFLTEFLENINNRSNQFKDKGRLPIKLVRGEHLVTHHLSINQLKALYSISELNLDLTAQSITSTTPILLENRVNDIREMMKEISEYQAKQPNELYSFPYMNIDHIACLLSNTCHELIYILLERNDESCKKILERFWGYKNFLSSAIKAGNFKPNEYGMFKKEQVQQFLYDNNFIIKGFNDGLAVPPITVPAQTATYSELKTENTSLKARIAELEQQLKQPQTSPSQPNYPTYTTPAMNVMYAVIKEFWQDYEPSKPAPKQSTITAWITDNFDDISNALALNIDKVCRHSNAKSGGKYKR